VLLLAVLVALAGCGGDTTTSSNTVNPELTGTPSPTATPTATPEYPPGVTAETVDLTSLRESHHAAFRSRNASYRVVRIVRASNGTASHDTANHDTASNGTASTGTASNRTASNGTASTGTVLYRADTLVKTSGDAFRSSSRQQFLRSTAPVPHVGNWTIWSNGTAEARRIVSPEGNVSLFFTDEQSEITPQPTGRTVVYSALAGVELNVTGIDDTANGTVFTLRGSTRERLGLRGKTQRNVTVVARVRSDGLVLSLRVEFEQDRGGTTVLVTERYEVTALDSVTVSRPEWVTRAQARAGNRTVG
jgi:hypothetical protein